MKLHSKHFEPASSKNYLFFLNSNIKLSTEMHLVNGIKMNERQKKKIICTSSITKKNCKTFKINFEMSNHV